MTATIVPTKPIIDELISVLSAALGGISEPIPVGDGEPPSRSPRRCAVVYPLPSVGSSAPLSTGRTDLVLSVQVTSVGATRGQVQWISDRVREHLDGLVLTVAGVRVAPWASEGPSMPTREGQDANALWNVTETFQAFASPT